MTAREIYSELKRIKNDLFNWEPVEDDDGNNYLSNYLGSYMDLDPCGRFHHVLSPNGVTNKCERYWRNMEKACIKLNMWLTDGPGDFCDVYLCKVKN